MPDERLDHIPAIIFPRGPLLCEIIGTNNWQGETTLYIRLPGAGGALINVATVTSAYRAVGPSDCATP